MDDRATERGRQIDRFHIDMEIEEGIERTAARKDRKREEVKRGERRGRRGLWGES